METLLAFFFSAPRSIADETIGSQVSSACCELRLRHILCCKALVDMSTQRTGTSTMSSLAALLQYRVCTQLTLLLPSSRYVLVV